MLKTIGWLLFSLAVTALTTTAQTKEEKQPRHEMRIMGDPGQIWMLPEVGMVAIEREGKVTVEAISPAQSRPKAYAAVDLQQGDIIVMANGKKIGSSKEISALYDSLQIGQDLKMGIKRGEKMMMVTVKKADPESLPQRKMIVSDGDAGQNWEAQGSHSIQIDPSVDNVTAVGGTGLMIGNKGKDIVVAGKMPHAKSILGDAAIGQGDIITHLQDKPVTTVAEFESAFDAIKIGDPVTITVLHDGKELKATFTKQESQFRTVIKKG